MNILHQITKVKQNPSLHVNIDYLYSPFITNASLLVVFLKRLLSLVFTFNNTYYSFTAVCDPVKCFVYRLIDFKQSVDSRHETLETTVTVPLVHCYKCPLFELI